MSIVLRSWLLLMLLAALPALAVAQTTKPTTQPAGETQPEAPAPGAGEADPAPDQPAAMMADEESLRLLEGMHAREYVTGDALKKFACRGSFSAKMPMTGQLQSGTFRYAWNGEEGDMTLDNPNQQMALQQTGFNGQMLDSIFSPEEWREAYAGCKLTAKKDGDQTRVSVDGQSANAMTAMVFNGDGFLTGFEMKPPQMPEPFKGTVAWTPAGEQWLRSGMDMQMNIPGMGEMTMAFRFEYQEVGGFHVWKQISQAMKMGGSDFSSIDVEFDQVQVNDQAPTSAKPTTEPGDEPTSQPKG